MTKKLSILIICLILIAGILVGCSDNYNQKTISTEFSEDITSNGGLSVIYGKYLYFINGYAGAESENTFGDAVKGAILRCELDENNHPIISTRQTIVPKNVYGSNKNVGIQIVDNFIYYTSPSTDKDKDGKYKTTLMDLFRTKVDGTGTEKIKTFDAYTVDFLFTKDYILYSYNQELHSINLNTKKFDDTTIDTKITAIKFPAVSDTKNSLKDIVFYTKASAKEEDFHNEVFYYKVGQGEKSETPLITKSSYEETLMHYDGYKLTIVDIVFLQNDSVRLIYNKTDNGTIIKKSEGTYYFDFDTTLAFDETLEVRIKDYVTYSNFYYIDENNAFATNGSTVELLTEKEDGSITTTKLLDKAITIFDFIIEEDLGILYYLEGNKIYRLPILKVVDGGYEYDRQSASIVFDAAFNSTWLSLDKCGSVIYFFNTNIKDTIYYTDLSKAEDRNPKSRIPTLLGNITMEDRVALLS